jgi:hypothetical protein
VLPGDLKHRHDPRSSANSDAGPAVFVVSLPFHPTLLQGKTTRSDNALYRRKSAARYVQDGELVQTLGRCVGPINWRRRSQSRDIAFKNEIDVDARIDIFDQESMNGSDEVEVFCNLAVNTFNAVARDFIDWRNVHLLPKVVSVNTHLRDFPPAVGFPLTFVFTVAESGAIAGFCRRLLANTQRCALPIAPIIALALSLLGRGAASTACGSCSERVRRRCERCHGTKARQDREGRCDRTLHGW